MKIFSLFCFTICVVYSITALPTPKIPQIDFYKSALDEDFNADELDLLKPIIDMLQTQYNELISKANENTNLVQETNGNPLNDLLKAVLSDFEDDDDILNIPLKYDVNLPTISDLEGSLNQLKSDEVTDLLNILQENIDDANENIQSLIEQSNVMAARLISINKIKIVKFIYKMLGNIFDIGIKVSRTAYCTYSYIPMVNSTLTEGGNAIDSCYVTTRNSIRHIKNEVQSSIITIRENVLDLIKIYKKIAKNNTLFGKLFSLLLNISKIKNDVTESRSTAIKSIEEVKTEIPTIKGTVQECATNTIPSFVQQLNETVSELLYCYNFVDDSTEGPEPEPETEEDISEELDTALTRKLV